MKRSIVMLPSLWIKWYSIARLRDVIGKEILSPSLGKTHGPLEDTLTFILSDTHRGKANHFRTVGLSNVFWILQWIPGLKLWVICVITFDFWLSYDQYEQNSEREVLVSLSSSTPFSVILSSCLSCDRTGVVLVCRYSHNFHIWWGSSGTSFWLKMFSHLNVINYYRADSTSLSYFCLITSHPLFKTLDTPIFC